MTTLNLNNAKERCRTCLRKLFKNEINPEDVFENIPVEGRINFVDINTYNGLREMLLKYVAIEGGEQEIIQCREEYPRNVCVDCLRQLETFEMFRNKALDSAEKLYRVFNGFPIDLNDNGLENKEAVRNKLLLGDVKDDHDIFSELFKDSLMETEAIMLDNHETDNDFNNMDPDPFQAASPQKQKRRIRKSKQQKGKAGEGSKKIKRKSKNSLKQEDGELAEDAVLNTKQEPQTGDEDEGGGFDGGDVDDDSESFEWPENELSDAEKAVKKVKRFRQKKLKLEREADSEEEDGASGDDPDFNIESTKKPKRSRKSNKNKQHELGEIGEDGTVIKVELQSDDSESSELNDGELKVKKLKIKCEIGSTIMKKRRHRILNSGRKKGLSNSFKCEQCGRRFGHKITLDAHIRKIHMGLKRAYQCQMCDKAYAFVGGLSTHIKSVHESKQSSYDCQVEGCDKVYSNLITLQRHIRIKHVSAEDATQYVCEQCGATFNQSANLRYHMRTRHPTEEDLKRKADLPRERLECEECKKSFHSLYTLKYHKLRVHASERKFECKVCGIRVAKKFMLISHMLVHSDQKMACKFCGREFVRKYQVEAHIRAVHHKLKPFQCPHCSESFASRKTLRHHIYIHTGEKPYVCDVCGQAYRQPTCLKNHKKIHMKLNPNDVTAAALAANRTFLNNFLQTASEQPVSEAAVNIMEAAAANIMESRAPNIMESRAANVMESRAANIMETRETNEINEMN